nr:MAG TPA: hypothetical protein [Caudoviricetes sp.]
MRSSCSSCACSAEPAGRPGITATRPAVKKYGQIELSSKPSLQTPLPPMSFRR